MGHPLMGEGYVNWKDEDEVDGQAIGPVWVNGERLEMWQTRRHAQRLAKELGLQFEEV